MGKRNTVYHYVENDTVIHMTDTEQPLLLKKGGEIVVNNKCYEVLRLIQKPTLYNKNVLVSVKESKPISEGMKRAFKSMR